MEKYVVNFRGYWIDSNKDSIPNQRGVYLVYRCQYNQELNRVILKELLYIGKSEHVNTRIAQHDKYQDFLSRCGINETLCYAFAPVEAEHLDIVENALIFAQQPPFNEQLKDVFLYDNSSFVVIGCCGLMQHTEFKIR